MQAEEEAHIRAEEEVRLKKGEEGGIASAIQDKVTPEHLYE